MDHHPTAPAFGFRFDTPDGSIVISGDTCVSENLLDLAQGCDFLVHEVIDEIWVDEFTAALPPDVGGPLEQHLLESHTSIGQVGDVAHRANAKNLVLTHFVPTAIPIKRFKKIKKTYDGPVHIGTDLMRLAVKKKYS